MDKIDIEFKKNNLIVNNKGITEKCKYKAIIMELFSVLNICQQTGVKPWCDVK